MAYIKKLRDYFYGTFTVNSNGKQTGFKNTDQPNQDRFEELMGSTPFFTEEGDRARQAAGGTVEDEVGLVTIAPDTEAKAGTSGLTASRTKVSHASQLPTSEAVSQVVGDFPSGDVLSIVADGGTSTRNKYLFTLATGFRDWLLTRLLPTGGTANQVLEKIDGTNYNVQWATPITADVAVYGTLENCTIHTCASNSTLGAQVGDPVSSITVNYMLVGKEVTLSIDNILFTPNSSLFLTNNLIGIDLTSQIAGDAFLKDINTALPLQTGTGILSTIDFHSISSLATNSTNCVSFIERTSGAATDVFFLRPDDAMAAIVADAPTSMGILASCKYTMV